MGRTVELRLGSRITVQIDRLGNGRSGTGKGPAHLAHMIRDIPQGA